MCYKPKSEREEELIPGLTGLLYDPIGFGNTLTVCHPDDTSDDITDDYVTICHPYPTYRDPKKY